MLDKFTGLTEGFPIQIEKAEEVVKKKKTKKKKKKKTQLLHEIILRFSLLRSLQSDNGTSFTSKVTQGSLKHWTLLIIPIVPGGPSLQEK